MPNSDLEVRKAKQKVYSSRYYERNKEKVRQASREKAIKLYAWWREYKASLGCFGCDENDPDCLEFHHVIADSKKDRDDTASRWLKNNWSKKRILDQIEKTCVPLCANCHRKVHALARQLINEENSSSSVPKRRRSSRNSGA